jgi:hypothetical protein
MQWRWATVLLLALAAVASVPVAAAADALAALDACIAELDADTDIGFERIAARCPEIAARLQASAWAAWLPLGWQDDYNNLSARSLAALRTEVARELLLRSSARTPPVALLRPILADLAARSPQPSGWWERLRSFLRALFAPEPKSRANWYDRMIGRVSLPEALLGLVAYAILALVVLLAAFIVVNEWRASRPQRRRTQTRDAARAAHAQPVRMLNWHDVECAAPAEQPRVLLELIAARLTAARRLPACRALTVGELTRAAEFADAADRERFGAVAFASERLRFSLEAPTPASVAQVLERGRELFERLGATAADGRAYGQIP